MAKRRNAYCRECGGHRDDVGTMSARGFCRTCSGEAITTNVQSMKTKRGENYSRWAQSMREVADQL